MRTARLLAFLTLVAGRLDATQARELPLANWQHTMWTGSAAPPVPGSHYLLGSPDGYLWLSAQNCLLRFDGVRFTVLDSTNVPELRSKETGDFIPIFLDRHGVMWIVGPDGERITYQNGEFSKAFKLEHGTGPDGEDDQGLIWTMKGKPYRYDNGRMSPIPLPAAFPADDIWAFVPDTGKGFWLGSRRHGIWHVSQTGEARQYGTGEMRPLIQARDGTIWALGMALKGTARLVGDRWIPLQLPADSVPVFGRFAVESRDGSIWFQTNAQGVVRYHNGVVEAFTRREGLSDRRLSDVYVDPSGVVWISTDAGLDRLRPALFAPLDPAHVTVDEVGAGFAPDMGGGMWVTDDADRTIVLIDGGILRPDNRPLTTRTFHLGEASWVSILGGSRRGGVWVHPFAGDVVHLMPDGTRQVFGANQGVPRARFNGGIETRDGTLWLEQGGGFGRLRNGRYKAITIGDSAVTANAYAEDRQGRLWLGWNDQSSLAVFQGDSIVDSVRVPTPHVDFLSFEGGDTLWAASEYGVVRIIGRKATAVPVPALSRVLVGNLTIAAAQGWLWVASSAGIARIPLAELHRVADGDTVSIRPQLLDALDGFAAPRTARMTWRGILQGADGRVWINTAEGLAVANSGATGPAGSPRVMIEEVRVDGVKLTDKGRTRPRPGRVEIHFTATGLELAERARLQYRMEGSDDHWVNATVPRLASYSNLAPGSYRFHVRALNADGGAGAEEAAIQFRVPPAWNQSWWFFGLLIGMIAATAGGAAVTWQRRRHQALARQAQTRFDAELAERRTQYEATLAERSRIAQDLHDTLLQGFAGVTLQLKTAELALPEQPDVAAETILRVQQLARASLKEARERVWDLRETEGGAHDLVESLEAILRDQLPGTSIASSVRATGSRRRLPRPVEDAVFRIAREAIVNAVRHAAARQIDVDLEFGTGIFRLQVSDDGRGLEPAAAEAARHSGHYGLSGMRERAHLVGGSCDIQPRSTGGTVVTLELPLA